MSKQRKKMVADLPGESAGIPTRDEIIASAPIKRGSQHDARKWSREEIHIYKRLRIPKEFKDIISGLNNIGGYTAIIKESFDDYMEGTIVPVPLSDDESKNKVYANCRLPLYMLEEIDARLNGYFHGMSQIISEILKAWLIKNDLLN